MATSPLITSEAACPGGLVVELTLGLRRQPGRLRRLSGPVGRRMRRHRKDLVAAAAAHGVSNLRVFGSVARGKPLLSLSLPMTAPGPRRPKKSHTTSVGSRKESDEPGT